jgi:hypothetical protein
VAQVGFLIIFFAIVGMLVYMGIRCKQIVVHGAKNNLKQLHLTMFWSGVGLIAGFILLSNYLDTLDPNYDSEWGPIGAFFTFVFAVPICALSLHCWLNVVREHTIRYYTKHLEKFILNGHHSSKPPLSTMMLVQTGFVILQSLYLLDIIVSRIVSLFGI